jgi:hypothetical protein
VVKGLSNQKIEEELIYISLKDVKANPQVPALKGSKNTPGHQPPALTPMLERERSA